MSVWQKKLLLSAFADNGNFFASSLLKILSKHENKPRLAFPIINTESTKNPLT